jgi:hypothetical protein
MWVEFDTIAYKRFLHLGRTIPDDTGVMVVPSFDYYDTLTDDTQNPWFKNVVEDVSKPECRKILQNVRALNVLLMHLFYLVLVHQP